MLRHWLRIVLIVAASLLPGWAAAQSACTAMLGIIDNDGSGGGTVNSLRYYNFSTNQWVSLGNLNGGAGSASGYNALAGRNSDGLLYYINRSTGDLRTVNLNSDPFVDAVLGTVNAPPAGGVASIIGATTDGSGNLYLYSTSGGNEYVGRVNLTTPGASTWTQVLVAGTGVNPPLGNSGDINCNNSGTCYIISNTAPPSYWELDLTPGPSFARVTSPSVAITGTGDPQNAGVAVNPVTGVTYAGFANLTSTTFVLASDFTSATLINSGGTYWVTDMGNCVVPPAAPSVSKSFSPTFQPGATGTSTAVITIGNTNTNPVWLLTTFTDALPSGMVIGNTPALTSTCSSTFGTPTVTAGGSTMTFAAGSRIPAGGCSISFTVSATASVTAYTNTIPAGSLTTTAGSNAATATATFKVGTDFSVTKSQRQGTTNTLQTTPLTLPAAQTLQYVLTIVNSASGGTGSVTFTDTLPTLVTPVLSITAVQSGGGTCTTASAVVSGATRVTGTVTNAPAGSTCVVTITAQGSSTIVSMTTVTNSVTIAPVASTADTDSSNNTAQVTTTFIPLANLQVTKTNGTNTVTAGGTTSYTITFTNSGPAAAGGAVVNDTLSAGLNCTTVTCTITGGASCPTGLTAGTPAGTDTVPNLFNGTGLSIATFPSGSTVTLVLQCNVTATGQ